MGTEAASVPISGPAPKRVVTPNHTNPDKNPQIFPQEMRTLYSSPRIAADIDHARRMPCHFRPQPSHQGMPAVLMDVSLPPAGLAGARVRGRCERGGHRESLVARPGA